MLNEFNNLLGWTFVVTLGARMLTVQVGAPTDALEYNTKGLLGNLNNDPNDDFISRNNTLYANSSSEETLFHDFGQTCKQSFYRT